MIVLVGCVILFHLLVFVQIIPYTIVWAGKVNSVSDMRMFESVSMAINVCLALVLLCRGHFIKNNISTKILNGIIWFFVIIFALNTVGNLFSETKFERYFFTALTFIATLLCLRIVVKDNY